VRSRIDGPFPPSIYGEVSMSKKQKPAADKSKGKSTPKKAADGQELSDDQLERVSGGSGVDMFLKLDGIKGESTTDKHLDEITTSTVSVQKVIKFFP
jgi:type VI protein secretion system component Hcp